MGLLEEGQRPMPGKAGTACCPAKILLLGKGRIQADLVGPHGGHDARIFAPVCGSFLYLAVSPLKLLNRELSLYN